MKSESQFETLLARARDEMPPDVNVAADVLMILSSGRVSEKPLVWLAAVSSAIAIPVAVLAGIVVYNSWADPLAELSKAISWVVMQ